MKTMNDYLCSYLEHLSIDTTVPALHPSRGPPPGEQEAFEFIDDAPDANDLLTDPPWQDDVSEVRAE